MDTPTTLTTRRTRRTRRGFTLTEMMVAVALSLGVVLIITEAVKSGLDAVRITNANIKLMDQLSGVSSMLEHDLAAPHFPTQAGKPNGGTKLSDQLMNQAGWVTPTGGYFHIEAGPPLIDVGGTTVNGFEPFLDREGNTLSSAANHRLQFTSIFSGQGDAELALAVSPAVNGQAYKSRAFEVAWFLVPTGQFTSQGPNKLPLYNLVRRYRLVATDDDNRAALDFAVKADAANPVPTVQEVVSVPNPNPTLIANTLATVADYANRLFVPPFPLAVNSPPMFPPNSPRYGEDVVATNVISFQVWAWWDGTPAARPYTTGVNTEAPFDFLQGGGVFDTRGPSNNPNAVPQNIRVRALKITIRIADVRVGIARSITKVIPM